MTDTTAAAAQPDLVFSQLDPDIDIETIEEHVKPLSQAKTTASQYRNLDNLTEVERESLICATARTMLFLGAAKMPLDKKKVLDVATKQYLANSGSSRLPSVMNAVFDSASQRLNDLFGYVVMPAPDFMFESLPKKYTDRFYLVNPIKDLDGTHSKALHAHDEDVAARGVLMVILAFAFCKGTLRSGIKKGVGGRWITGAVLYRLLNSLDDRFPDEPPRIIKGLSSRSRTRIEGLPCDFETLLDRFVAQDYLLREKDEQYDQEDRDGVQYVYMMGPRSALEIGRKQLVYFCAEVLDEQEPDPTMLKEIDGFSEDEDEEEEE